MKHSGLVRWMGVVLVAVIAFGAVGMAAAQGPGGRTPLADRAPGLRGADERVIGQLVQAVADSTGLDVQDVRTAVRDGQTINDIRLCCKKWMPKSRRQKEAKQRAGAYTANPNSPAMN